MRLLSLKTPLLRHSFPCKDQADKDGSLSVLSQSSGIPEAQAQGRDLPVSGSYVLVHDLVKVSPGFKNILIAMPPMAMAINMIARKITSMTF